TPAPRRQRQRRPQTTSTRIAYREKDQRLAVEDSWAILRNTARVGNPRSSPDSDSESGLCAPAGPDCTLGLASRRRPPCAPAVAVGRGGENPSRHVVTYFSPHGLAKLCAHGSATAI